VCYDEGSEAAEAKSEKSEDFAEPPPPSEARSHRTEVESTLRGVTDCGSLLAAEFWRCPRCGATKQDWGDVISMASGGSVGNDSVAYRAGRALPSLRTAPPGNGHGDLQTLFEWAPEVCRDVVPEAAATYRLVHNAALSLEGQEHVQYTQGLELTIVDLLLVGLRLEKEWSGLRQGWHNVVSFVVGAHPVPLRRFVHFEPGADPAEPQQQQVAWQLPRFPGSDVSPNWWELRPEEMYNNVRSSVLSRIDMFARQAARRAGALRSQALRGVASPTFSRTTSPQT